jgi:predicted RNase H-like nuclease (RuvC/YqgF family)
MMNNDAIPPDRNRLAVERFGHPYDTLSAWARSEIDRDTYAAPEEEKPPVRVSEVLNENKNLKRTIEDLHEENGILWEENEELKLQLYRWENEGGI